MCYKDEGNETVDFVYSVCLWVLAAYTSCIIGTAFMLFQRCCW